jgi:hypothetical protein
MAVNVQHGHLPVLHRLRGRTWIVGALGLGLLAWAVTAVPPWLLQRHIAPETLLAILGTTMAVSLTNAVIELRDPELPRSREWTAWRFLLSLVAAGIVLGLQAANVVPLWNPNSL